MSAARAAAGAGRYKPYPAYKDSGVEWLGEIPAHWEVKRLRFVSESNPVPSEVRGVPGDTEISFVPMEAISERGGISLETTKLLADVKAGYTYFRDGDIVIAKITPCFENGKGALAAGLTNGIAFGTTELHVLRTTERADRRFMFYVTLSDAFRRLGEADMHGAGGQKRVSESFVRNFSPALPSLPEQRAIAAFLDRETARIDALVAKKERLIALLQEQRTALITRAVTKGLDPTVPMKDSGVEWLGEIPAHWECGALRRFWAVVDCKHRTASYVVDGIPIVSTTEVKPGRLTLDGPRRISEADFSDLTEGGRRPRRGDIVYSRNASLGAAAYVDTEEPFCMGQDVCLITSGRDQLYLAYQLNSPVVLGQIEAVSVGSTFERINVAQIKAFAVAYPPMSEQLEIAAFLDQQTAWLDTLVAKIREAIDRLKELRTALISAAVTGKIDVREEVA